MKPGDAVLVEATLEYAGARLCGVTLLAEGGHGLMGGVPISACHALPDEATRRRAAELAAKMDESARGRDELAAMASNALLGAMHTRSASDARITARALSLLAGTAAEDKPAAQEGGS